MRAVFDLAFDADPEERDAILDRECGEDRELREQVEELLAAAEDGSFLTDVSQEGARVDPARMRAVFDVTFDADPETRGAILDRECGEDRSLRQQVEELLAVAEDGSILTEVSDAPDAPPDPDRDPVDDGPIPRERAGQRIGRYKMLHCLLYTSPSPRDQRGSRMPSSA